MPCRPRRLSSLCLFSRQRPVSPTSTSPSTPGARPASFPVTPPPRLHLRNILPASPQSMPTPPLPPRDPYPWLWRCHSCMIVYRLACTRRCLNCSHVYCASAPPQKGKKRRRNAPMCVSEFDYQGWADWGEWRRRVRGQDAGALARNRAFANGRHNCEYDCDFPSECHHERYRLQTADALRARQRLEHPVVTPTLTMPPPPPPTAVTSTRSNPDDELPLNEALELRQTADENEESKSPTSPLREAFSIWDDADQKEEVRIWWAEEIAEKKKQKTGSKQKDKQFTGAESATIEAVTSPGVDIVNMDSDTLYEFLKEVGAKISRDTQEQTSEPRCESRLSHRKSPKSKRRLTVRNSTEAGELEVHDNSSDSDSDSCSSLSCQSSSASASSDGEWVPASGETSGSEMDNEDKEDKDEEEKLDRELRAMIEAEKSFLLDD